MDARERSLDDIYERLGAPSAKQLRFAALQDGLRVSPQEAQAFVNKQQENQIFRQKPSSDGVTASRGPGVELQLDLVDLKQFGNSNKVILVAMDPNNRKVAMEGLTSKKAEVVRDGFARILQRMPKPQAVSSDFGNEFKHSFDLYLNQEGIVHKYKRSRNSLARLDRGIMSLKKQIFKRLAKKGDLKWDSLIPDVERAYNDSLGALGTTPNQAAKDDKLGRIEQFQIQKENAENFEHNQEVSDRKTEALKKAGAFRQAVSSTSFDRSFKPTLGDKREVVKVERGQVTDSRGKTVAINEVVPVDATVADRPVPDMRGRGLRDNRTREDLRPFARDLWDALGNNELSLTAAARLMGEEFTRAKPSTLLFSQFLALYPTLFTKTGAGPATKVRRIARRLRGKQAI